MGFSMRSLTNAEHPFLAAARALWLLFVMFMCAVQSNASEVSVRQVGDDVLLDASIQLAMPASIESVLRNGVPLTLVQEVRVTQSRWYWTDKDVLKQRREWTIAYQALTNQWRVANDRNAEIQQFDNPGAAWRAITQIDQWPLAKVRQLGALEQAQVILRWYVDRQKLSGGAIPNLSLPSNFDFEVYATASMRAIVAPVRDALSPAEGKTP
jgi:hypothetical protein